MIRGTMWVVAAVGLMVVANSPVQANPGHHGHGHGHHHHGYRHHHHGYYGPRFDLMIAPPVVPVVAAPPVRPYPVPTYGYPVYSYAPVYAPAPIGFGVQTRNFSFFMGR